MLIQLCMCICTELMNKIFPQAFDEETFGIKAKAATRPGPAKCAPCEGGENASATRGRK